MEQEWYEPFRVKFEEVGIRGFEFDTRSIMLPGHERYIFIVVGENGKYNVIHSYDVEPYTQLEYNDLSFDEVVEHILQIR